MKDRLLECQLYGIIDLSYIDSADISRVAEAMIKGGVDLIQLRGKKQSIDELVDLAAELHELTTRSFAPLLVNDHAEIARRVPVEGVHVGQDDDSIEVVRRISPPARARQNACFSTSNLEPRTSKIPNVCPRCWLHRTRHGQDAGRGTFRFIRWLGLLRGTWREFFLPGPARRRRRRRLSRIGI